jgi:phosphatidylglycerol:prolipoprotein diacylglycerol transferase
MFPDLIDIGFLHLKTYGACMACGFLVCWKLAERLGARSDLGNLMVSLMVGGILGSRAAYVIEHWKSEFAANPTSIIRIDQGGLMFYGGFILALAIFFGWCFWRKERALAMADLFAVLVPLGHAFGRIGCFFYGCCYGRDSDAWCAVTFPAGSPSWYEHGRRMVSVLPTQLFEAAALIALFSFLLWLYREKYLKLRLRLGEGVVCAVYLVGYAMVRFGMEFLRGDPRAEFGPFSISQVISMAMVALGAGIVCVSAARRGNSHNDRKVV